MSNWKRGFLEIIAELLENLLNNPMKKTQLSQKCNLDYRAVTKYLVQLESLRLVKRSIEDHSVYVITTKGSSFVYHYQLLVEFIESDLEDLTKPKIESSVKQK